MTQETNTPSLTESELKQLRDRLPLLLKVIGILEAETVILDEGITVDDRSPYLDLLLPHFSNRLDKDMPRLRETLLDLDTFAEKISEALTVESGIRADIEAAIRRELTAGDQAVLKALSEAVQTLNSTLESEIEQEAATRFASDKALEDALEAETQARQTADIEHNKSPVAHDALVRRITVGDISPVIGICQVENGNYTGLWYHVDAEGQPVTPNKRYFDYHPIYNGMRRVLVDGQVMIEIPAFWYKHFVAERGPFAGKWCKVISPEPAEGFTLYPMFRSPAGVELSKIYIGAYAATNEGGSPVKLGSRPGKYPHNNETLAVMATKIENRNVGGVTGFHMWDIYEYTALCLLFLIEHAHTDSQLVMGRGWVDSSSSVTVDDERQCVWRGFYGLFGNVWQFIDGLRLKGNREIEIFKNDGSRTWVATGKMCPSYDGTNACRITGLHSGSGAGFNLDELLLPATQSTNFSLGMFPDNFWGGYGSGGNIPMIGGAYGTSSGAGLFCLYSVTLSWSGTHGGCRSAKW